MVNELFERIEPKVGKKSQTSRKIENSTDNWKISHLKRPVKEYIILVSLKLNRPEDRKIESHQGNSKECV